MPPNQPSALVPAAFERFGDLLRFLRRRARLTQRDLSIAVGYNFAHISRLEAGQRLPDPAVVAATFVPALELGDAPEWAARLIELANQAARQQAEAAAASELSAPAPLPAPPARPAMPLLATKLYLPRPRGDSVPRPRLLALLDRSWSVPLALLSAPAGFGKTTLLTHWLAARPAGTTAAWLSLDPGDNDPITWLSYLVAACQTLLPGAGATTLAMLTLPQLPPLPLLLTPLLNDLLALPADAALVLDDYHLITAPAIHDALTFLLDHLPPALHLVIASRTDPPLALARLRARRAVAELHAPQLRFTPAESFAFLHDTMSLGITAAEADLLDARTEGWIAGLQLAGLALHDRPDRAAFIESFSGSNRYVADYLAAEVLERLPAHLRAFVLQTAVLDQLCGPLCDAVLGVGDPEAGERGSYSQIVLEELERQHMFLISLDDERRWYRYHHLFGEMLLGRLRSGVARAEIDMLHERAGHWFAQQGQATEAAHHLLAGHRWEQAAEIIETDGLPLVVRGQIQTVLQWIKRLPEEVIRVRPLLAHGYAVALMATNQFAAARAVAGEAERSLPPDISGDFAGLVRGRLKGVQGHIAFITGDAAQGEQLMREGLALMPQASPHPKYGPMIAITRSAIDVYGLAMDLALTGDATAAAEQRAAQGIAQATATGNTSAVLNGYGYLASVQLLQGRLHMAAATYAQAKQLVSGGDSTNLLFGTPAYYVGIGELHYAWNELEAAERALDYAMAFARGDLAIDANVMLRGAVALAQTQQIRGNGAAALATLDELVSLARQRGLFHSIVEQAEAARARLLLLQGQLTAALEWAATSAVSIDDAADYPCEPAHLTLARTRIAAGQADTIMPLLGRLLADAEAKQRRHSTLAILILQARASDVQGHREVALALLERALAIGAPGGYVRPFLDEGELIQALLHALAARREPGSYAARLLAAA